MIEGGGLQDDQKKKERKGKQRNKKKSAEKRKKNNDREGQARNVMKKSKHTTNSHLDYRKTDHRENITRVAISYVIQRF